MKRKTYNNVLKAIKLIENKGYNFQESSEIALKVFEQHENDIMSIEFYIDKICEKEQFEKETEL